MSRAKRRRTRTMTESGEWARRRDYVLRHWAGDELLECGEFWASEPDVPDELRSDPDRWRHLLAPPDVAAAIIARRAEMLAARRAWLVEHDYR